jgi:hypothetical protein
MSFALIMFNTLIFAISPEIKKVFSPFFIDSQIIRMPL